MSDYGSAFSPDARAEAFQAQAQEAGFDTCGFTSLPIELRETYYLQWLAEGKHGTMQWMERNNDRRLHPETIVPQARTVIALGMNYYQPLPDRRGRMARYALGSDYHKLIYKRLKRLCTWLREQGGEQKPYVDTGPLMEKSLAEYAGLGWQAKNTLLTHTRFGPWLFLGCIVTTLEFPATPRVSDHCGHCVRCLDACPTGAITAPYQLDATRCIAYWTIEHDGAIPESMRPLIGDRIFGCDECLDVCPWNRRAQQTREMKFAARPLPDLAKMLAWDTSDFENTFSGTPVKRLGLSRWKRNLCVALGNVGTPDDLCALEQCLATAEPLVAEHARWAINEIKERSRIR